MPSIGASNIMGIAPEVTANTYVAPAKFIPYDEENLNWQQDPVTRRPLRNTPGLVGIMPGNAHIEGDIKMDALTDVLVYFMKASRCTLVKTGAGPYVYTYTPVANGIAASTMSITVKRGSEVMGYTGCVLGGLTLTVDDNGVMKASAKIVGSDEATQAALTGIVWPTSVPFNAGQYKLQIPTATQVFDTDTFECEINDNAEPQFRMKDTGRGAQFIKFGESEAKISVTRDWETRAQYDIYKALTAQSITLDASQSASEKISILMPVGYTSSYEIETGGPGDLVRANVEYEGGIDGTGKHYQLTITSTVNVT